MQISNGNSILLRRHLFRISRIASERPSLGRLVKQIEYVVPFDYYGAFFFPGAGNADPRVVSDKPEQFSELFSRCLEVHGCARPLGRSVRVFPLPPLEHPAGCIAFGRKGDSGRDFSGVEEALLFFLVSAFPEGLQDCSVDYSFGSLGPFASLGNAAEVKYEFSRREQEILSLLSQGLSNADIGRVLQIAENTVKRHLYNMYNKAGVSSRIRLLRLLSRESVDHGYSR